MDPETEIEIEKALGAATKEAIKDNIARAQVAIARARKNAQPIIDTARRNEIDEEIRKINLNSLVVKAEAAAAVVARVDADDGKAAKATLKDAEDASACVNAAVSEITKLCKQLNELNEKSNR